MSYSILCPFVPACGQFEGCQLEWIESWSAGWGQRQAGDPKAEYLPMTTTWSTGMHTWEGGHEMKLEIWYNTTLFRLHHWYLEMGYLGQEVQENGRGGPSPLSRQIQGVAQEGQRRAPKKNTFAISEESNCQPPQCSSGRTPQPSACLLWEHLSFCGLRCPLQFLGCCLLLCQSPPDASRQPHCPGQPDGRKESRENKPLCCSVGHREGVHLCTTFLDLAQSEPPWPQDTSPSVLHTWEKIKT